ncbi:uncharacterized protein LOC107982198 [Nasonia vitripennis]|uniref:Uncharacterized protein n=1 Tax=Nasonia vitripennis TaxID=7425 RepID=A0A7M7J2K5_NASVI|nr:uncharacterized protein LOC107982198 [Nasonia vitripennis]
MSATLLLTLFLFSSSSALNLGSILGIPELRSAATEAPALPEIVEVVRWRQPVCVMPESKQVPSCAFFISKHQSEYERTSDNALDTKLDALPKKTLNAGEVRSKISIDEIEPSSVLQSSEEILERVDAQSTPALEDAVNGRRSQRSFFEGGRANNQLDTTKPPPIFVTKVLNSPTTATLVARNCWPDIGVPLCEDKVAKMLNALPKELSTDDSSTMLSFKLPLPSLNQTQPTVKMPKFPFTLMKTLHDLFFHGSVNATGDAAHFGSNLTSTAEPSAFGSVHKLLHGPRINEFVTDLSAIEKKVGVEMMTPFDIINAMMEDARKAKEEKELAKSAAIHDMIEKKHEVLQSIVEKKEAAVQSLVDKSQQVLDTISNAAAGKKAFVQGVLDKKHEAVQGVFDKKHEVVQGVLDKKQAALQAIADKKNQLVDVHIYQQSVIESIADKKNQLVDMKQSVIESIDDKKKQLVDVKQSVIDGIADKKDQLVDVKQDVIASIAESLSQKKDSVVQAIADKQAAIKGIVEKTQSVMQELIDKKVALEMDIASRGQSLVQNIADKKVQLIQGIAEKKQSMIQHLADKKTDAIKAFSDKTQEIIGTVSVMKPMLISSIQQNLGIAPKETPFDDSDFETTAATITTTAAKDDEIIFQEESTDVEEVPLVDERSAANVSIVAESESATTTTEKFYEVINNGLEGASGRSAAEIRDIKKKYIASKLNHLKNLIKVSAKPGIQVFLDDNIAENNIAPKPNQFLTHLFSGVLFNHRKPASNDSIASISSITQTAPIVTESADPVTSKQEAPEVTSALPDKITSAQHDSLEEDEFVGELPLNSSSARPPMQSLSLPAFVEENEKEPDADQLEVVDDYFVSGSTMSKEPPAEVSFSPSSTTEDDDDEPIIIDYKPTTTASPKTKPIVPNADSNERPAVLTGFAKPDGNGDGFVIVGDLQFVDNKPNCTQGVPEDAEQETLQET